ncbi:MAG: sugar phosphate isomerase/epimerase family protein [Pirellulales bacterium]|jgi:sugar phosphate isomerase/epimerase
MSSSSRRRFLASSAVGVLAGTAGGRSLAATPPAARSFPLIGFTKPFADLSFDATADLVAEVGWDGVEVAVREGNSTHIAPARVEDDLPRMVEALGKRSKQLAIVTTSVVALDSAGERVLKATAAAGIPRVRLGFLKYPQDGDPAKRVADLHAALADVAAACRDLGLQAGYQNHSGAGYVGAAVWDLHEALADLDPKHVGGCFDIAHATVEGGLAWPLHARLMADHLVAVFCKDFYWERNDAGQKLRWCPLGEGVVQKSFFDWLKTTGFSGPISQHHEYGGLGTGPAMVTHLKRDLARLREWLEA